MGEGTDAWVTSSKAGGPFTPDEHALRARRQGLRADALAACGGASLAAVQTRRGQGLS
ncbi:MAG: hypothetical protein WCJ66_19330 [Verrucomicrobiota bacterium]